VRTPFLTGSAILCLVAAIALAISPPAEQAAAPRAAD